jgi:cellulose synthase/poly-beta-1,6-N-acetylglucosamine synthase-like glycosyltransferase
MELIFWTSLGVIIYVYVGYSVVLRVMALRARPTSRDENYLPSVSLIIAAYNEEKVLRDKIENSSALDYPRDRLEIVVASDGSTDGTNDIAESYADRGIILHKVIPRGGKTRALNTVIPQTRGEILVLSDANTMYQPEALRKLVRHFVDPTVGAVSGDVRLVNAAESHAHSEGFYYRYERWLQRLESRVGSVIGADGGMYAVARRHFRPPVNSIILDDFVISMTVARLGFRVLYDPEAIAIEQGTLSGREEFSRKARIIAGGVQALRLRAGVPSLRQPLLMLGYISHKLLRWLMPCLLLLIFVSSTALAREPFYSLALGAQALFYIVALGYGLNAFGLRRLRLSGIPYYFSLVNSAALFGIWKGLWGTQRVTWQRTTR